MMKVKDLIIELHKCNKEWDILFSSDEELNCLRKVCQIGVDTNTKEYYIYGLDGTEVYNEMDD